MTRFKILLSVTIALVLGILALGCDNDHDSMSMTSGQPAAIDRVTPSDGATDVARDESIALKFTGPVDTLSVMNNLHLAGGPSMQEWRDSLNHYGGYGMMSTQMRDHMTKWMDSIHVEGTYHWNATMDSCEFAPDSMLDGSTEYICLLNEGNMRDMQGGMMGGANHGDSGYHTFGFTTGPVVGVGAPELVFTVPAHGTTGVGSGSSILLAFNMPMDSLSVMGDCHLAGGDEMQQWMDSLNGHMGMGGMGMVDMNHMMMWLDSIQHDGGFRWNASMDTCEFVPDPEMLPGTEYMMYLRGDILGHNGERMDMHHLQYDGYMIHFETRP